ncbi:cyanidin 3-O-rutinoside 5-O-glucosyltransferase [Brachypodium distachyon]|uniref:Glycosyltransferase n=1 Tax=Brachypodium distachyon TaxID=15368 RepID=I1GXN6_BRADI|nr:cyanidin 3-O-rutinoside 5-O-glucosyltransferase [Brachypodium distachyon]KQK17834.1 hypothetical protein BRADI_1g37030v3 [Brachypodium distachyon]|eukprot:XP_003560621.1 cyanidin 3-O-rutinoside 5-O-glucosyltransferase [Brachypodium distachyon]
MSPPRPHFLVLTFPLQGHITPALRLARRLLAASPDALVTFSTTAAAHRRMFPPPETTKPQDDGRLELLPFSDGTEGGFVRSSDPQAFNGYMASFHAAGARSVGELLVALAARGRAVTRVVYTLLLPWAADVARDRGLHSALYWIQPAAVFAVYHHYFRGGHAAAAAIVQHGHDPSFLVRLPGLPPLALRDLPSFLTESTDPSDQFHSVYTAIRDLFDFDPLDDKDAPKATVLVNTCQELEAGALAAMAEEYDMLPVGPLLPTSSGDDEAGLFKQDEDARYMEWLDGKPANSVVYVAFGSLARMEREQLDELLRGLEESGRPYLCVVRKDVKAELLNPEGTTSAGETDAGDKDGMVVEWCDQVRVLSHPAVGCFVTHCGWNSTLESVACGVPMVCVPRLSDQRMNAWLVEREWRVGARAEVGGDGVLRAAELRRRVEEVMREEEAVRRRAAAGEWKRAVADALGNGGSSDRNLTAFVRGGGVSVGTGLQA